MSSANSSSNSTSTFTKSKVDAAGGSADLSLEVLKVDHSVVAKELAKFRACEPITRTIYCREWSQYIYKRHFAYNAKTQEDVTQLRTISGPGGYKLSIGGPSPDTREIASSVCTRISKQMESYFLGNQKPDQQLGEFLNDLLKECETWQKLPNSMSWLPDFFEPIYFDSFPDAISLPDDPKDPSQLLDALIIDKTSLSLPSSSFRLLKNLTGEVLASQSQPICGHSKPFAKTPAELEVDRKIFTEKFEEISNSAYTDIESILLRVWSDLNSTLNGLRSLVDDWRREMGPDLTTVLSEFCRKNRDRLMGFNEYWNPYAETFKKKKSTVSVEDIDKAFFQYLDNMKGFAQCFDNEFMKPRYKSAVKLIQSLQSLCGDVLEKKFQDMQKHGVDKFHKAVLDSCSTARNFVLKSDHAENVQGNIEAVQDKMEVALQEFFDEIESVKLQYCNESQKTPVGRLEKLAHKDFKKRFKKLENLQQSLRQLFATEFMTGIFPEQQFAQMALVTLISIMQEGEQMECDEMDNYMFDFVDENDDLLVLRDDLILDFEEGVHTGRTQLAGLIGKLYLKEGMRIQGDSLALKRQNSLLKSIGVATETGEESATSPNASSGGSKKKKKKKKTASAAVTAENDQTPADSSVTAETLSSATVPNVTAKTASKITKSISSSPEATEPAKQKEPTKSVVNTPLNETKPALTKPSALTPARNTPTSSGDVASNKANDRSDKNAQNNSKSKPDLASLAKIRQAPMPAATAADDAKTVLSTEANKPEANKPVAKKPVPKPEDQLAKPSNVNNSKSSSDASIAGGNNMAKSVENQADSMASLMENNDSSAKLSSLPKPSNESPKAKEWKSTVAASTTKLMSGFTPSPKEMIKEDVSMKTKLSSTPTAQSWSDNGSGPFAKPQSALGMSTWAEAAQSPTSTPSQVWGHIPEPTPKHNVWEEPDHPRLADQDFKTDIGSLNRSATPINTESECLAESTDSLEVNESDIQLTFKLSSILDEHEKSLQTTVVKRPQEAPSSVQEDVVEKIRVAPFDNTPKMPPGLQTASLIGSHTHVDGLGHQPPNNALAMVANLQAENAQLMNALVSKQRELSDMNTRYGELLKLARERDARTASEMEEARRYVLKLEAKVHLLERNDNTSFDFNRRYDESEIGRTNANRYDESENSYSTSEHYGEQGHEERRRQPLSKPRRQPSTGANESFDRRRNLWRDTRVIKCGNCGEAGHKSSDCQDACRYCGSKSHLSESCELVV